MEINTIALRELIVEQLNESEFSTICFDLNETYPELKFDFDKDIPGHLNFSSKVMETIKYMRRRTALEKLVAQIHKAWPGIDLTAVGYKPTPATLPVNPNPPAEQPAVNTPQPTQPSNPVKPATEYVDFDIRIREKSERGYPIEASFNINGRAGTPTFYQPFNLDDPEFKNLRTFLEGLVAEESDTKQFGKQLGLWLFPYEIRSLYSSLQGRLGSSKGIRLRLEIDPAELSSLPWEYCYDDLRQGYIAKNRLTPVVRYIDQPYIPDSIEAPRPLKILMVLANPQNLPALDAQKELTLLQNALQPLGNQVQIEVLQGLEANARKVHGKILDFQPHVLHFVGHGQFKDDKGSIILVNSEGQAVAWDEEQFADTLQNSSVKLVVLNACETAKRSEQHALVGVAPRLIVKGIPAVVAMQFVVPDKVALVITETLYENLVRGQALDEAITQMRIAVHNMDEVALRVLWAVPVLFMRSPDGRLWGKPAGENPTPTANPTTQPTTQIKQSNSGNSGGFNFNIAGNATFTGDQIMGDKNVTINNYTSTNPDTPQKEPTLAERIQKISQDLTQKASQLPPDQLQEAQGYLKDAEEKAQAPAPSSALIKFRLEKTLEIVLVHLNGDPNLVGQLDLAISLSKKI